MDIQNKAKLMRQSRRIARGLAPMETGNLRYNAINYRSRYNGFDIVYSALQANYLHAVREMKIKQGYRDFVNEARFAVMALASAHISGNEKGNVNSFLKKSQEELLKDRDKQNLDMLKDRRERNNLSKLRYWGGEYYR